MILSNDCEDGSDEMLDHLSKSGEIIHLRNDGPSDDRGIQFAALFQGDNVPHLPNIVKSVEPAEFFRRRGFCPRLQP